MAGGWLPARRSEGRAITANLILDGERRRDRGTALARRRHYVRAVRGELLLLAALADPGARVSTDVIADDPAVAYREGGRWVGAVALGLVRAGILCRVGDTLSARPSTHRRRIGLYIVANRSAYERRRAVLPALIRDAELAELAPYGAASCDLASDWSI